MVREPHGGRGLDRPVPRLRAHGAGHARPHRRLALLALAAAEPSRRGERLRAAAERARAAATPARPRSPTTRSRASTTTPTGSPIAPSPSSIRSATHERLARVDELPRPASSLGPARRRGAARSDGRTSTCRRDIRDRRRRSAPILAAEAAPLARLVRGALPQQRGRADDLRALRADARPDPRGQRHRARRERAHRRGLRARAAAHRGARLGRRHGRLLHHRSRRAAGRLRPALQGAVPRRRADADPAAVAAGAVRRRRPGRDRRSRSASSTWRRRSASIAGVPVPEWMQGAPLPTAPGSGRERVITEWDSQFAADRHAPADHLPRRLRLHRLRAEHARRRLQPGARVPRLRRRPAAARRLATRAAKASCTTSPPIRCSGATCGATRATAGCDRDLVADLYDHLPPRRDPQLTVDAPA